MPISTGLRMYPGDTLEARELQQLRETIDRLSRIRGGGGVSVIDSGGGPQIYYSADQIIHAKITGAPTGSAYPWSEVFWAGTAWVVDNNGRSGTVSNLPAREINGNTSVASGTFVDLWPAQDAMSYTFVAPGSGGTTINVDHNGTLVSTRGSINLIDQADAATFNRLDWSVVDNNVSSRADITPQVRRYGSARVYLINDFAVAPATDTQISFDVARWDDGQPTAWWSNSSPDVLTAPYSGRFIVGASVCWDGNTTGNRLAYISANGSGPPGIFAVSLVSASVTTGDGILASYSPYHAFSGEMTLSAGDTVSLNVYQDSGASRTIHGTNSTGKAFGCEFWVGRAG
jgi:hypothetical protein